MGIFSGGNGGAGAAAGAASKHAGAGGAHSLLGQGSRIEGVARFAGALRIDGAFEGTLDVGETLVIGKPGELTGEVRARDVVICGGVRGTITASQSVELQKGCRVEGDVRTRTFVVEEGVFFQGHCFMEEADAGGPAERLSAGLETLRPEPAPAVPAGADAGRAPLAAAARKL